MRHKRQTSERNNWNSKQILFLSWRTELRIVSEVIIVIINVISEISSTLSSHLKLCTMCGTLFQGDEGFDYHSSNLHRRDGLIISSSWPERINFIMGSISEEEKWAIAKQDGFFSTRYSSRKKNISKIVCNFLKSIKKRLRVPDRRCQLSRQSHLFLFGSLPPPHVPVVDPGHSDLGDGHLVSKEVEIVRDLRQVLESGILVLLEQLLGVGQIVLQHHIGPEPQTNLKRKKRHGKC